MNSFDHYIKASYDLVVSGEVNTSLYLDENVEHYLVFLLARHFDKPNFEGGKTVAEMALEAKQEPNDDKRHAALKQVGDVCLLVSSLVPFYKMRRGIKPKYYVDMGRAAFGTLSGMKYNYTDVYERVYQDFPKMRDVLEQVFGYERKYTAEQNLALIECESRTALQQQGPTIIVGPWLK
jgi:hypothetical protein